MRRLYRSTKIIILVTLIILVLWALAGILNLFTPILVSKNGPSGIEFTFHRLQSLYRLTLPHKTRRLYDSLPPDIIDIDWLKRYNSDDMYWLPYGLTGEEATDEYFDSLLSKDVDDLTSEEIRHLFGYLRGADTIEKLQNEVFIQLQEKYFDSQDEMLSFASNWVDLSEYGIQLPDDIAYLDALYDQIEDGVLYDVNSGLPLEMAVIGIIGELPSWAQDPSCVLSKNQTLRLIREANMEGTTLKVLLPQLRRNAERNGIILREDLTTPVMNIKAAYVEKKFEEMGLL